MEDLIPQGAYAKKLYPLLPKAAFQPDPSKLVLLFANLLILILGGAMGSQLRHWPPQWLWLYLPFSLVMANSVTFLAFVNHDLLHGSIIRNRKLAHTIALFGLTAVWMPPTLWKIIHNRIHHNHTNAVVDPDRNYTYQQPNTVGKRVQRCLVPSSELARPWLALGLLVQWSVYAFRNVLSVLVGRDSLQKYAPATFTVSTQDRRAIAREFAVMVSLHLGVLAWLAFDPLQVLLAYALPLSLGHGGMMAYIYTNHLFSPMTSVNDPLANSVSLQVGRFFDVLHIHFSHHAEHHIFPGLNSDYYPLVRALLAQQYPERKGYVIRGQQAWHLLLSTPRQYLDDVTLTDWHGQEQVSCHLNF